MQEELLEKVISLAKRRGFIFPSSEIYGGFRSSYDYGPLGVLLKNNVKQSWWEEMLLAHESIVGLDAAILMSPRVWEASGHTSAGFADELAECLNCHKRWRHDHVQGKCPDCKKALGKPKKFNLLVETSLGPVEDSTTRTYFRPETAQGIYVNFSNVQQTMRMKIPFGIAQIGKAFRNEITPGPFVFRMREFEQMEMQWFCRPANRKSPIANRKIKKSISDARQAVSEQTPEEWFAYWKDERMRWYVEHLGIGESHLRFRVHKKTELAHYAKAAADIEYSYPWGWGEFEGIHNRGDWDLRNHTESSGSDLRYFDEETNERFIPQVIETSGGIDRTVLVLLLEHYGEDEIGGERRVVVRFPVRLAPIKLAVLPLVRNKASVVEKARKVYERLRGRWPALYDEVGSIGRRYRRQDEVGTPLSLTIDFETLEENTLTVRDRDSTKQIRVAITKLEEYLSKTLSPKL